MNKRIRTGLLLAGLQIAVALFAVGGKKLGYFDGDTVVRLTMTGIGVMLIITANGSSKVVARSARGIASHRFLGWSMLLGALVWTLSWALAPMDYAGLVAMGAVLLGTVAPFAYCLLSRPKTAA